jgi:hypothetical protein
MARTNCECCGKQIVNYQVSTLDKYCAPAKGAKPLGTGRWCCGHCAEDLDEHGLFPEERHLAHELYGLPLK